MFFKIPQNSGRFHWTNHSIEKMKFYRISQSKVKNVLSRPDRKEEGIAPKTLAVMQKVKNNKRPSEIWVMYQSKNQNSIRQSADKNNNFGNIIYKIISAWRYPGISPACGKIPIPEDILAELAQSIQL